MKAILEYLGIGSASAAMVYAVAQNTSDVWDTHVAPAILLIVSLGGGQ